MCFADCTTRTAVRVELADVALEATEVNQYGA